MPSAFENCLDCCPGLTATSRAQTGHSHFALTLQRHNEYIRLLGRTRGDRIGAS
jgi:hypothetical protein